MQRLVTIVFTLLFLLTLSNMLAAYYWGHPIYKLLFNADAVYLPTLFTDIFARDGSIADWYITRAPYFFPDVPLFGLAAAVSATITSATAGDTIIIFALLQQLLTFIAIYLLMRIISPKRAFAASVLSFCALMALTLMNTELLDTTELRDNFITAFHYSLSSVHHYGAFLSGLVFAVFYLLAHPEQTKSESTRRRYWRGLCLLAFVMGISDKLFIVQVTVPFLLVSLVIEAKHNRLQRQNWRQLLWLATPFAASLLGALAINLIPNVHSSASLGTGLVVQNIIAEVAIFNAAFRHLPLYAICFSLYSTISAYTVYRLLKTQRSQTAETATPALTSLIIYAGFSLCVTFVVVSLLSSGGARARYLIPVFSWPVIILSGFLAQTTRRAFLPIAIILSSLSVLTLSLGAYKLMQKNKKRAHFYPPSIACIDKTLSPTGLTNGITEYWDAKAIQMLSQLPLTLAQHRAVSPTLIREWHTITSKQYFKPAYDFAIIRRQPTERHDRFTHALSALNGTPQHTQQCPEHTVYIYGKNELHVKAPGRFHAAGDSLSWQGCQLHTRIGETTGDCTLTKRSPELSGYLTYGPYERLPAGEYNFTLRYTSSAAPERTVGRWDVIIPITDNYQKLTKGKLKGSRGQVQTLSANFTIEPFYHLNEVEIRTYARRNTDISVLELTISKLR